MVEFKIFKNKKGINDISIISIILIIFFSTSIIIPFVNAEFGTTADTFDNEAFAGDIRSKSEDIAGSTLSTSISAFTVLKTLIKLAFFDFGNTLGLPFWLDAIYTILAIIFIAVVARNIWVGGGG